MTEYERGHVEGASQAKNDAATQIAAVLGVQLSAGSPNERFAQAKLQVRQVFNHLRDAAKLQALIARYKKD